MRIGVFCYDFSHKKSRDGLFNMFLEDYTPEVVFAAPWRKLNVGQSKIKLETSGIEYAHPRTICKRFDINYHVVVHNSVECRRLIESYDLDLGVILGARILDKHIINAFKIGVLNLHPGILPGNRGLDTVKWAVIEKLPQGATAHLINGKIDMGRKIVAKKVLVRADDTLPDILCRVQAAEQAILAQALWIIKNGSRGTPLGEGKYHKVMPPEIEAKL